MRAKLAASVGMNHRPGCGSAQRDRVGQGVDRELRGHPVAHRVAHDPVGAVVFHRAEVKLSGACWVLRQIGEPEPVGSLGSELSCDEIVGDAVEAAVISSSRSAIFNHRFRQDSEIPKLRATFAID